MIITPGCTIQLKMANCCIDIQKIESPPSLPPKDEEETKDFKI